MKGNVFYTFVLYALNTMIPTKAHEQLNNILRIMPTTQDDLYILPNFTRSKIEEKGPKVMESVQKIKDILKLKEVSIEKAQNLYPEIYQELMNYKTDQVLSMWDYCEQINQRVQRLNCDFVISQKMILVYLKEIYLIDSLSYNMNDKDSVVFTEAGRNMGFSLAKKISGIGVNVHTYYTMEMNEQAQDFLNKSLWYIFYKYFASNPLNYIRNHPEADVELTRETLMFVSAVRKKIKDCILESIKKLHIPNAILEYFEMLNMDTGD